MLKKRFAAAIAAVCMIAGINASAKTIETTVGDTNVYVSDKAIEQKTVEAAPYIENGRTMVPIRFISENFDAAVDWNESEQKVTITSGESVIELFIGNKNSYINGEQKELDASPIIINGRTMVPLRFVSEALGKFVEYVSASKQIMISDLPPILNVNGELFTVDDYKFILSSYGIPYDEATLSEVLPSLTQYFAQIGSVYSEAKKDENALIGENIQAEESIAKTIMESKESIYPTSLAATVVKMTITLSHADEFVSKITPEISDEDIKTIYENEYVRAKHILVSTFDEETGESLSEADIAKAKKEAQEALKKAKKGEDFDKLIEKYNDDPGMSANPDGYVFTKNQMVKEFETASFELEENKISDIVETNYGYHIIQKLTLPDLSEDIKYEIMQTLMQDSINSVVSDIVTNADVKQYMTNEEIIKCILGE